MKTNKFNGEGSIIFFFPLPHLLDPIDALPLDLYLTQQILGIIYASL